MGHSLGLEHSSNPEAVMSTFFSNNPTDIKLHQDDVAGIQSLYGEYQNICKISSGKGRPSDICF